MGCGSSRPVDIDDAQNDRLPPPEVRNSPQAITSQTAINPTTSRRLELPSATSLHQSETSRSGLSTPRQSTARRTSQPVSLAEHYNLPLQIPKAWKSKDRTWNRSQLRRERNEFFETRVTGRREVWEALRQVGDCLREGDLPTAQSILDAVGFTLPTGRLEEGGYDEAGNLYKLPENILSDPTNLDEKEDEQTSVEKVKDVTSVTEDEDFSKEILTETANPDKGKAPVEKDALKIKCRLSDRGGPDVVVLLGRTQSVSVLTKRIRDEVALPSSARVRVAYLGRILDDRQSLLAQDWKEGHVINVLISGVYS